MLPKIFKPLYEYDLIRVGGDNDGGYVVEKASFLNSKLLISAGLSYDFEFEDQFIKLNKNNVICFDHTLNFKYYFFTWFCIFLMRIVLLKKIKSIKKAFSNMLKPIKLNFFLKNKKIILKKIGLGLGEKKISLNKLFDEYIFTDNIFLKIDIEGDEYRLLSDILNQSKKISSLVIEFHDVDLNLEKVKKFINELELELVHIHPNNQGGSNFIGDPTIIELTFVKSPKRVDKKNTCNNLDKDNNPKLKPIKMKFEN